MSFIPLFLQDAAAAGAAGSFGMLFPLILVVIIMYFFMIRPQNQKQKETEKMLAALKKGDKVVTIGGIHGTISAVKENVVTVKVDDNVKVEFNRSAIATVLSDRPVAAAAPAAAEKKGLFGFLKKKDAVAAPAAPAAEAPAADSGAKKDE